MKRVIVRYTDGGEEEAWLQPTTTCSTTASSPGRLPRPGHRRGLDHRRRARACQAFFALKRAGLVTEGEFMEWYKRVAEVEPRFSHRDVDELMAAGSQTAEAEYLHSGSRSSVTARGNLRRRLRNSGRGAGCGFGLDLQHCDGEVFAASWRCSSSERERRREELRSGTRSEGVSGISSKALGPAGPGSPPSFASTASRRRSPRCACWTATSTPVSCAA